MEKIQFGWYSAFIFPVFTAMIFWVGCSHVNAARSMVQERTEISFDKDWHFKLYKPGTDDSSWGLEKNDYDDSDWRVLDVPHDWAIEGGFSMDLPNRTGRLPSPGLGWYRKHFKVPASDQDKRIFIDFDGAMSRTKVWLNGEYVGQWPYGYASFRLELTEHVKFGQENVLAVRLNNPDDSSRWYPGGGIYRHVRMVKTNPIHVAHWGTYVTTPEVSSESALVRIQTEVQNQSDQDTTVMVRHEVALADTPNVIIEKNKSDEMSIAAGEVKKTTNSVHVKNPRLWDIKSPMLYVLRTTVSKDGQTQDVYETSFGIRTIEFDAKKGFLLNGERVYLKGVCLHHDLGPLGAAVHRRGIERQLEILKAMGCNAIRTAHNPPTPELLDLCDQMGFVVIDEAFDCWRGGKTKNDYSSLFEEWYEKDLVAVVRRDRNHPSVIMWSSGNEIREQGNPRRGHKLSRHLTSIFHREDPTRPVTAGCDNPRSFLNGFADTVDVFGFNYKPHLYQDFSQKRPTQPFYGSETSSCVSSRGEYFFPVSEERDGGEFNYQISSYDLYYPKWASGVDKEFAEQDKNPTCLGEFVWTGFDYLGEPTPYNKDETIGLNYHTEAEKKAFQEMLKKMDGKSPSRSSYFGIVDLCGFKKDRFYLYQARWRPELAMAHILPHWNWPNRIGEVTPVHVYTSGDEAELFLNGKSLGRKKKEKFQYRLRWDDVVYEPGKLKVVAYKGGKKWAEDVVETTGKPTVLKMAADQVKIDADGRDLSYLTVEVLDENGRLVPRSNPMITFSIDGPGEIAATGNGDSTNLTSFLSTNRNAYNGLCLAIVRSLDSKTGTIRVTATANGLKPAEVTIDSR